MTDAPKRHLLIFFKTGGVVKIEDLPVDETQQDEVKGGPFTNLGIFK